MFWLAGALKRARYLTAFVYRSLISDLCPLPVTGSRSLLSPFLQPDEFTGPIFALDLHTIAFFAAVPDTGNE